MNIQKSFPSKYVKSSDLPDGKYISVVIDYVEVDNVAGPGQPEEAKPILYFKDKEKGLVLNKTNANTISAAYGDETNDWAGKPILLYTTDVAFQGKMVPSIRVKIAKSGAAATPAANGAAAKAPAPRRQTVPAEAAPVAAEDEYTPFEEGAPPADDMDNPPW